MSDSKDVLDTLARSVGGWPDNYRVHLIKVIGKGDDPQVLLEGSDAVWMPQGKRWKYVGPSQQAVVRLSEYRATFAEAIGQ